MADPTLPAAHLSARERLRSTPDADAHYHTARVELRRDCREQRRVQCVSHQSAPEPYEGGALPGRQRRGRVHRKPELVPFGVVHRRVEHAAARQG